MHHLPYSGKLSRSRENLCEFHSFVAICENFLCKIFGHGVIWCSKSEKSAKVFSVKIVFFTNSRKFSPSKVLHYTVFTSYL